MSDTTPQPTQQIAPLLTKQDLELKAAHENEIRGKLEKGAEVSKQRILAQNPADKDMAILTIDVEKDLMYYIITHIEKHSLTFEQSQELARKFLSLLPLHDKQDLLAKLQTMEQISPDVKEVYIKYAKQYELEDKEKKLELMRHHIQNGNLDQAIEVAKGGTN